MGNGSPAPPGPATPAGTARELASRSVGMGAGNGVSMAVRVWSSIAPVAGNAAACWQAVVRRGGGGFREGVGVKGLVRLRVGEGRGGGGRRGGDRRGNGGDDRKSRADRRPQARAVGLRRRRIQMAARSRVRVGDEAV